MLVRRIVPANGLSAHSADAGFVTTGHVGPTDTLPRTVMVPDERVEGHTNAQLGPLRPTYEPSGHCFASEVQTLPMSPPAVVLASITGSVTGGTGSVEVGMRSWIVLGHGVNSHAGPWRLTMVPSLQTRASRVQPEAGSFFGEKVQAPVLAQKPNAPKPTSVSTPIVRTPKKYLFMSRSARCVPISIT